MAVKKTRKRPAAKKRKRSGPFEHLQRELVGLFWLALGGLAALALFGRAGSVSIPLREALTWFAGDTAPVVPLGLAVAGLLLLVQARLKLAPLRRLGWILLWIEIAAALHWPIPLGQAFAAAAQGQGGGMLGAVFAYALKWAFGNWGGALLLIIAGLASLLLITQRSIGQALSGFGVWLGLALRQSALRIFYFLFEPVDETQPEKTRTKSASAMEAAAASLPEPPLELMAQAEHASDVLPLPESVGEPDIIPEQPEPVTATADQDSEVPPMAEPVARHTDADKPPLGPVEQTTLPISLQHGEAAAYQLPPLSLLSRGGSGRNNPAKQRQDQRQRAQLLEQTLQSFNIQARVVGVDQGPAVTRFEVQPASGVKVSRIVALADDIALALAATDVRIVAPIPGKSAVGIEVPNRSVRAVSLREVLESEPFQRAPSRLTLALGEDITGQPIVAPLERMLHVLIAGSTGSGKSVCINTILMSILFKARPDEVKLLLIDPKMVELSNYNGIPHLLAPVVTDPKQAAVALKWAVKEMTDRYEHFANWGVRDITRFNEAALAKEKRPLPYIVIVIDELADLMLVAAREVEDAIQRLAQMARAAGIHLLVATQRPSVDVITGVIKANIPSRIAFAVSSQADSRTILDGGGAEKLLGKGDMLFYPIGAPKPVRTQGALVTEAELESVLTHVRQQAENARKKTQEQADQSEGDEETALTTEAPLVFEVKESDTNDEESDPLFVDALRIVIETGQASVSQLQRRLRIGFTRAGRLVDMMERRGFVGPHQGSKARDVLITQEMFEKLFEQ